ncbi:hypothetical protein BJV74DRAFT_792688 [Russula compacta]|nr:hypothetical protein BJV74DRAFT_792688 [Russula compacta]
MPLSVPVETLDYILELAVALPDFVKNRFAHIPAYPETHGPPLRDIKLSTQTLFSLTLVCRQWNTICTPRLYRCLTIVDTTATNALLHTLEHSQTTTAVSGRFPPLGSLTRHLIIALSDFPGPGREDERLHTRVLRRFGNLGPLARCLPHLQILSISISTQEMWNLPVPYYGKDFADIVTQTCAQSLRELHLYHQPSVLFSHQELRRLLESAPNLVVIAGASARLTSVSLDLRYRFYLDMEDCCNCLSMLASLCPNLTYLEIAVESWPSFSKLDPLPSVEQLGISLKAGKTAVAAICEALATIRSSSLKVVHLVDPYMLDWFASPLSENVESAWSPLVGHTFLVVDIDGRELGPPGRSS